MEESRDNISDEPQREQDERLIHLDYAGPRLVPRYQQDGLWKSICRAVAVLILVNLLGGYVLTLLALLWQVKICVFIALAALSMVMMLQHERSPVLRSSRWDDANDRRATTWRASAARFDSSGVHQVDPHALETRSRQSDS